MTNEEKKLEELENAAVKKSNTAKRVLAAAGLTVAGGGAGAGAVYGANRYMAGQHNHVNDVDDLDEDMLDDVIDAGARQVEKPADTPDQHSHGGHSGGGHHGGHTNNDDDVDVSFDRTTNYYDENGNAVMQEEEGTIDGQNFKLVDVDGDGEADLMALDKNGDGIYSPDESIDVSDQHIAMGHYTPQNDVVFIDQPANGGEGGSGLYNLPEEKDYVAENDLQNEKEGTRVTDGTPETGGDDDRYVAYGDEDEADEFTASSVSETEESDMFDDLGGDSFDLA